jgi:uncharacterized protein YggE
MKKLLFFIFISICGLASAQSGEKNFIDQNYIEVTGTAEMNIVPDEIEITISVSEKDFKTKQSFPEYEKEIISRLKAIGINIEKEFSIMDINSRLKSSFLKRNDVYNAKQYVVVVHDASTANKIFESLEKMGINNMVISKFNHSDIEKYRREVKINAVKAAKEKASALAQAIGQTAGRALYIAEINVQPWQNNMYSNQVINMNKEMDEGGDTVDFQKIKLKSSYTIRFELK